MELASIGNFLTFIVYYDGPEGPLLSSMVSCEVFLESDIVLGSLRQFLELSNSSRKSQAIIGIFKQFSELSYSQGSKKIVRIFKKFSVLSESVCRATKRCVGKIGTLQQNHGIKSLKEFYFLLKLQRTVGLLRA